MISPGSERVRKNVPVLCHAEARPEGLAWIDKADADLLKTHPRTSARGHEDWVYEGRDAALYPQRSAVPQFAGSTGRNWHA